MKVILNADQASELRFVDNKLLVRSCFYLGMGILQIKPLIYGGPLYSAEREYMVDTAKMLGMTDADEVIVNDV